ncbi:SDR family NAD(P)-dependent oxidoreductase [Acinetobacter rongchengensis]|uniref:SDR family NAD(P)-dependent oxidoreductase n=1 Tax=Acinetobacter rongchengensis TaxID=2419601 RepID=A0A3A8ES56_9GAMM|nr:SDR family NAD(P)-dependent oxidoreductase [Acinetobacter rongchengensis]RKG37712.1 SDR family NAD(P)-dependent oxidoreductase [Acinetobacter rongchengensis]
MKKTILITGANAGIGLTTAEEFVKEGHHVILACRNLEKAEQAKQHLQSIGTGQVDLVQLDLNSLEKVSLAADEVLSKYSHIDVLVNNAGLISQNLDITEDGFEKHFGVNFLGHFLWTLKLLPIVKKSVQGRIIHLSSIGHWGGSIQPEKFLAKNNKHYIMFPSYGSSKLQNLLFSNLLATQLEGSNVTSNALHPGAVDSELYRQLPKFQYAFVSLVLIPPSKPANLIKRMALDEDWATKNGEYASVQTPAWASKKSKDLKLAQYLYDLSYDLVKTYL